MNEFKIFKRVIIILFRIAALRFFAVADNSRLCVSSGLTLRASNNTHLPYKIFFDTFVYILSEQAITPSTSTLKINRAIVQLTNRRHISMPEYQGLVYTIATTKRLPNKVKKGSVLEAKTSTLNWMTNWFYKKSTQVEIETRLDTMRDKIETHLRNGYGVLVVCQYRCHGPDDQLHTVFVGAKALTRTLAMSIHNHRYAQPQLRPAPPSGWHICKETYLWFDQTKQPNPHLDNAEKVKARDAKLNQGPQWEAAK